MYLDFNIHARYELIVLGERIGHAIRQSDRARPWMISIEGDFDSGKSLVALAIDTVTRPGLYRNGIRPSMSADAMMMPRQTGLQTVFSNFGHILKLTRESFDARLAEYEAENPAARILIASNIDRTNSENFNYQALGLDSDRLDLAVQVHKLPGDFERKVAVTFEDPALKPAFTL